MQDDLDAVALLTLASDGVHPMGFFMDPSCPAEGLGLRPWPGAGWGLLSTAGSGGEAGLSLLPLTLLVLGATAGGDSFGSSRGPDAHLERKREGALTVPGGGRSAGCPRAPPPDAGRGLSPTQSGGESRPRTRPCSHRLPGGKARPIASPAPPPTRAPRSLRPPVAGGVRGVCGRAVVAVCVLRLASCSVCGPLARKTAFPGASFSVCPGASGFSASSAASPR